MRDGVSALLLLGGTFFFIAGSAGVLRFPDLYTRLHAVTKADNLGLGMLVLGLALQADSGWTALELLLIWATALLASATSSHAIARAALRNGVRPWTAK
jgi:multicomponent Na+:H+ antiporter subunit G